MFTLRFLRDDSAENSIMQTITIAVSAILIAAGLMTAPGLIINAQDNNATNDLANLAFAEEYNQSNNGHYYANVQPGESGTMYDLGSTVGGIYNIRGPHYTLSGSVTKQHALVCSNPDFYLMRAESKSGHLFFRTSASAGVTQNINSLTLPSCITANSDYATFIAGGDLP